MGTLNSDAMFFIGQVLRQLNDETGVYWEPFEVQQWVNAVQRVMCLWKPDSYVVTKWANLVAGPRQELPQDGLVLVDVVRNGGDNAYVVTRTDYKDLPRNWPSRVVRPTGLGVTHYMYNPSDPKAYYIFPHYEAVTTQQLEIVYGAVAPDVDVFLFQDEPNPTPSQSRIEVDDLHALHDGVMGRCCLKQTGHAIAERAQMYLNNFAAALGKAAAAQIAADPNAKVDQRVEDEKK